MRKSIIVDANSFGSNLRHDVRQAIADGKVKVVIPLEGKFREELRNSNKSLFATYSNSGRFHYICVKQLHETCKRLKSAECTACRRFRKCNCIKSNDSHVIALAIVSGANILVSNDKKLSEDFKRCTKTHINLGGKRDHLLPVDGKRRVISSNETGTPSKSVRKIISEVYPSHGSGSCVGNFELCRNGSLSNTE